MTERQCDLIFWAAIGALCVGLVVFTVGFVIYDHNHPCAVRSQEVRCVKGCNHPCLERR